MTLRDRLRRFSAARRVTFGAAVALACGAFRRSVPPTFEDLRSVAA